MLMSTDKLLALKTSSGNSMGVIGINTDLNSTFVSLMNCSPKVSSECYAEVLTQDSSGFLLAGNVIDK